MDRGPEAGGLTGPAPPPLLAVERGGRGPTLVLLHGLGGSTEIWRPLAECLEDDFDVVRLDLLGFGRSPKPAGEYTVERHLASVEATLAALEVPRPFLLAGLSMGALLALHLAGTRPGATSRLVGLGLPYYRDRAEAALRVRTNGTIRLALDHPARARVLITVGWGIGRRLSVLGRVFGPRFYTPAMIRLGLAATFGAFRSSIIRCMVEEPAPPLLDATAGIPLLLVHGGDDHWSPASGLVTDMRARARVTVAVLDGVGHNVAVLAPRATAELMREFLLEPP